MANYDLGVFYMPYWLFPGTDPMEGNWKLINDYDTFVINSGHTERARIPMNNYWPSPVWYDEKLPSVTEKQLELMKAHELDFVVFDSYWIHDQVSGDYVASWNHVLENIKQPGFNFHGMEFALMWGNQFTEMVQRTSCERYFRGGPFGGLDAMVTYWSQFFNHPNYKKIDGKPVFYIFYPSTESQNFPTAERGDFYTTNSIEGICTFCEHDPFFAPMGSDADENYDSYISHKKTKFMLDRIQAILGFDLYLVAVIYPEISHLENQPDHDWAIKYQWLLQHPQIAGYDAVTTYGYKYFDHSDAWPGGSTQLCNGHSSPLNWNYNYDYMQQVYLKYYNYMITNSSLSYQVPVSAGWNQGPINMPRKLNGELGQENSDACNFYSVDPLDQAISTPSSFEQSLINAKNLADANPDRTGNIIMISAWNEYAEGTVIEPTYVWEMQYLQKIKDVFQ